MRNNMLCLTVCMVLVAAIGYGGGDEPNRARSPSSLNGEGASEVHSWRGPVPGWSIVTVHSIPNNASGLAYDGQYLYCGIYGANGDEVYRINPSTGDYVLLFDNGPQEDAFGLTYDGEYLWTTDHPGSSTDSAIAMQIDMDGNLVSQFRLPDHYMSGIAYDNGDFWVATYYPDPGTIYKVDTLENVLRQFTPPNDQPWDLCFENGYLWMADYWGDRLYKIDTLSGDTVESHSSEHVDPAGIVWDGQYLWYCDEGAGGYDYLYKVDLSGAGTPDIYLPVTSHDYGVVTIGDSVTWNATVQNVGTADLILDSISFSSPEELSCTLVFPVTVNPASETEIPIMYAPVGFGPLDSSATVHSNDPVDPQVGITLNGYGVHPGPEIQLQDTSHDYGSVRAGAYPGWFMEIENAGDEVLTIDSITSDDGHFVVDNRRSFPIEITVLSSEGIWIWFKPGTAVQCSTELSIHSNDSDESLRVVSVEGSTFDSDYPVGELLWDHQITGGYDNSPKAIAPIPDINGDSVADVIICSEDDYVRCLNGNSHAVGDVIWEHEIYAGAVYSQNGLAVTEDLDDDGYSDVVVASAWGGRLIRAISGRNGEEIWTHDTREYGDGGWVYQVDCSYDYSGDDIIDVLATTGDDATDTGPKRVYCLNGFNGVSIWECPLGGPGFSVKGIEDFTGDGQPDVLAGASNEDESIGKAFGIDGASGNKLWPFSTASTSVWALEQIDDVTDDGIKDVIIGDFNGNFYGLDATDGSLEYSGSGYGTMTRFEKLDDVSEDGRPDIVPGHGGSSVRVIDGYTGNFVWTRPVVDKPWNLDRIDDITGDGTNDLVVGTLFTDNYCYFLSGADGSALDSINLGTPVDAIGGIPDIVGDESMEMVAGGRNGYVACFSGGIDVALLCGDANGDGRVTIADATYIVTFIYRGGPAPLGPGDVNLDGRITIADATYIVSYIYREGSEPCEPPPGYSPYSEEVATVGLGDASVQRGIVEIPVVASFEVPIAAIHIEVSYDCERLESIGQTLSSRTKDFDLFSRESDEQNSVVVGMLSLSGNLVEPGTGTVAALRFLSLKEDASASAVGIDRAVLVDEHSRELKTILLGQRLDLKPTDVFSLNQNRPNPFRVGTSIYYTLPGDGSAGTRVLLEVFDSAGRLVKKLVDEEKSPGRYAAAWDGRDGLGRRVGAGVYFYRIEARTISNQDGGAEASDFTSTRKMILVR